MFRWPVEGFTPDYVLHAPVVTMEWDHLWMGAREATNNTGELSAIGEAIRWLLDEAPDAGDMPAHIRSILTTSDLTVPVAGGRLALGTWQGLYLYEHRTAAHRRRVLVTVAD